MEFISQSPEETQKIAAEIAQKIERPCVIFLEGDMGAGKTTFTQGLLDGWGIEHKAKSPTYTLERFYGDEIRHCDFYRLKEDDHLMQETVREIIDEAEESLIIEWPSQIIHPEIKEIHRIIITDQGKDERKIELIMQT